MATKAEPELLIGELADRAGLDPKTIRYYEHVGLLEAPARSESGYRLYHDSDAERLRFIRGVRRLGFSLGRSGRSSCSAIKERRHAATWPSGSTCGPARSTTRSES